MQGTLLGLGIALILAIAAALFAPAYVDWNGWRTEFEAQATQLAGAPVRIRGPIEATLLPVPGFVFHDVQIGDPDQGAGIRAAEVRGTVSLGALMRGTVEAEEFALSRPVMQLAIEQDGQITLPGAIAVGLHNISISRIAVSDGSLAIHDRATGGSLVFTNLSATGELRSGQGPARIDATADLGGRRWNMRVSAGRFGGDRSGRVRFVLERRDDGTLIDADGLLAVVKGEPRFEGKLQFVRRDVALPWRIGAVAKADAGLVALEQIELAFGEDAPHAFSGSLQFSPQLGGPIEGTLAARSIDLERISGGAPETAQTRGAAATLAALKALVGAFEGLPFAGKLGIEIEALAVAGGSIRDVKADLLFANGGISLGRMHARLPGRGALQAKSVGSAIDMDLEAEDSAAFTRWLFGSGSEMAIDGRAPLRFSGRIETAQGRTAIDRLEFALGDARLSGRVVAEEGNRVTADVVANDIDLDLLAPLLKAATAGSGSLQLTFRGRGLRALGQRLASIDATLSRSPERISIETLQVDDFGGLSANARGTIEGLAGPEKASGRIEFELGIRQADGFAALLGSFAGEEAAALFRHTAAAGLPLRVTGSVAGDGPAVATRADLRFEHASGLMEARIDLGHRRIATSRIAVRADDGRAVLALLGVRRHSIPGASSLEIATAAVQSEGLPVDLRLTLPGAALSARGTIATVGGRFEPKLDVALQATDLRPVLAEFAGADELPGSGSLRITRAGDALVAEDIALSIGGSRTFGRLVLNGLEKPALHGALSMGRLELATLLRTVLGRVEGGSPWSDTPFSAPPFAALTGRIDLNIAALGLASPLTATDASVALRLGLNEVVFDKIAADLAGGKLSGSMRFLRSDGLSTSARLSLQSFDLARLIDPSTWRAPVRGRGTVDVTVAASGRSPAALIGGLAGQGMVTIESLAIDRLDPRAFETVLGAATGQPPDKMGTTALLAQALTNGSMQIDKLAAPVTIAEGVARSGKALAETGPVELFVDGMLDVRALSMELTMEMELKSGTGVTARPGATVRWRGPLSAPEREIDATRLATALALRAIEREMNKLEQRERIALLGRSREGDAVLPDRPGPASPTPATTGPANAGTPSEDQTATVRGLALPARVPVPPQRPPGLGPAVTSAPLPPINAPRVPSISAPPISGNAVEPRTDAVFQSRPPVVPPQSADPRPPRPPLPQTAPR